DLWRKSGNLHRGSGKAARGIESELHSRRQREKQAVRTTQGKAQSLSIPNVERRISEGRINAGGACKRQIGNAVVVDTPTDPDRQASAAECIPTEPQPGQHALRFVGGCESVFGDPHLAVRTLFVESGAGAGREEAARG